VEKRCGVSDGGEEFSRSFVFVSFMLGGVLKA
jgi:hypothetical protein